MIPARPAALIAAVLAYCLGAAVSAVQVPAQALDAFDRYRQRSDEAFFEEVRDPARFLNIWTLEGSERDEAFALVRSGRSFVRQLRRAPAGYPEIEDGLIHHWIGTAYLPGVELDRVLALARDYDGYREVFAPDVLASRIIARNGPDELRVYLRLYKKKLVSFVFDTEHEVRYWRPSPDRAYSLATASLVREVENAGTPDERQREDGDGFLWRIHTYWRYAQVDGGVFVENESLMLTREPGFPASLVIGGLVRNGPRDGVATALAALSRALTTP